MWLTVGRIENLIWELKVKKCIGYSVENMNTSVKVLKGSVLLDDFKKNGLEA